MMPQDGPAHAAPVAAVAAGTTAPEVWRCPAAHAAATRVARVRAPPVSMDARGTTALTRTRTRRVASPPAVSGCPLGVWERAAGTTRRTLPPPRTMPAGYGIPDFRTPGTGCAPARAPRGKR